METTNLLASVVMFMLISSSSAYDFFVGGRNGWMVNQAQTFNQWAEKNRFHVNDNLVFKYNKTEDSVHLVSKKDYESCNTNNPIKRMDDGSSVFRFDRSGHFFFISGAPSKCEKGEKMVVAVLAVRGGKKAPLSPSVLPSLPPVASALAPSPGGSAAGGFHSAAPAPSLAESGTSSAVTAVTVSRVLLAMALLGGVYFV